MDIAVTGFAGFEGSRRIYSEAAYRKKLLSRYPESFFTVFSYGADSAYGLRADTRDIFVRTDGRGNALCDPDMRREYDRLYRSMNEANLAADSAEGGVLAALWRLLKANSLGGTYSLTAIPVLQQTIEVCEMFGLNPYRLHSPECRVWLIKDMAELKSTAAGAGVPLSVTGFTTKGSAIRRTDTYVESSLRRPEADEILKVFPAGAV